MKGLLVLGLSIPYEPHAGMFIWADCGRDSEVLARLAAERGLLLAPGTLFSPTQARSTMLRFSVAMIEYPKFWVQLKQIVSDAGLKA